MAEAKDASDLNLTERDPKALNSSVQVKKHLLKISRRKTFVI